MRMIGVLCLLVAVSAACDDDDSGPGAARPDCPSSTDEPVAVVVNELMAASAITLRNEDGVSFDWVEIYNAGTSDADLCGYSITNDLRDPYKAFLGPDAVVPAGGYLVVRFGDEGITGVVPFGLDKQGGELGIADRRGMYIARLSYGQQAVDISAAREPDSSDGWVFEWHPSPGAPNPAGSGAPLAPHDLESPPEQIPAVGDISEKILGYDVIPHIGIRVAAGQVAHLEIAPYEYVPGYLVYDGREYGAVGVRLKGQNSFMPFHMKPSFRINIDEYVPDAKFFELDDLTLNNMKDDLSMMHERLGYRFAREVGPASRANHAVVTVNGQLYGLYANVETVKWHMIGRWFDDPNGPLFEGENVDFVPGHVDLFEYESGPDDRSKLSALAEALSNPNPDAAIAAAKAHIDMDNFLGFWAMEAIVGQFDALPYSFPGDDYFAYVDPATDKLNLLPWGMDESFYAGSNDVTNVSSVLATTCKASSSCFQAFVAKLWQLVARFEGFDMLGERERVAAQIAPHVVADPRKPYDDDTVAEYQGHLYWFIKERRASLEAILGPSPE